MNQKHRFFYLFLITSLIYLMISGCGSQGQPEDRLPTDLIQNPNTAEGSLRDARLPVIQFDKVFHDFGKLIQGEQVSIGFKFRNIGEGDLIIARVSTTCGCIVPSYPTHPISKGEEEVITVQLDSKGRRGKQVNTVTILANTQPNTTRLTIQANIITPETMNY